MDLSTGHVGCDPDDVAKVMAALASPSRLEIIALPPTRRIGRHDIPPPRPAAPRRSRHLPPGRNPDPEPDRRPPRAAPVHGRLRDSQPSDPARRPDPTMTTAPAPPHQAPPVPEWTGAAVDYDAWFDRQWGHHAFAVESAAVLRAAGAIASTRVLDAGCGTGRFSAALAAGDASVVAVDPDPDMLEVARDQLPGGCARAVVEQLPFPDDAFDLTVAVTVLEFVADPAVAVAELARVTGDGGRIVIGALNPHSPWGLANRRRLRAGVWCHARFLSPGALRTLGAPHGESAVHGALYAPGAFPGLTAVGPLLECAGLVAPHWGAFQVLVIDKHPHR